jgi:hypothetical protein
MKTEPKLKCDVRRHNLTQPEEIDLIWIDMTSHDLTAEIPISGDALSSLTGRDSAGDESAD